MFGYMGLILKINLTKGLIEKEPFNDIFSRSLLGGNGFAAKLIYDLVPQNTDAFSEDNCVVFSAGPFTNTPVWGANRGHLATISPLTGLFIDSNIGGAFPSMMKKAGFDAVVISGKSPKPVYLVIEDTTAVIKDASFLWGTDTDQANKLLREKEGKDIETAVIGPAGENGVLYASVMGSGNRLSTAGRGGIGAVLGAKNCKAVVSKGSSKNEIADATELKRYLKIHLSDLLEKAKPISTIGTPILMKKNNARGMLGTRNNNRETFEKVDLISGEHIAKHYLKNRTACKGCPVGCGKTVSVPHGEFADKQVKMPEYETLYALGSMLENSDIVSIFNGNAMCDQMGLDTISFGLTLAFLLECIDKGMVGKRDLGMDVTFGDNIPLAKIIQDTAHRKGIGQHLALGSEKLAKQFGPDVQKFLYSVKGLEIAGHSARGQRHLGLAYATSNRGGSHQDARPQYPDDTSDPGFEKQPAFCISSQHNSTIGDSLVICRFVSERVFGAHLSVDLVKLINLVTGWDMDLDELNTIAERIYNLERMINVKQGADRRLDTLPYKITHQSIPDGPLKGRYCPQTELDKMLDQYYHLRGWDENGIPNREKLSQLGIDC